MPEPVLTIDLDKLSHNARLIVDLCRKHGLAVSGVTKSCCGEPVVARALLAGGVAGLADSRLANVARLRRAGITAEIILLRAPASHEIADTVRLADISLNSEIEIVRSLSREAVRCGKRHGVIVMVDSGDLREGVWPGRLEKILSDMRGLPGIRLVGIGTNHACLSGVLPSKDNVCAFVRMAKAVSARLGLKITRLSGGNSSALHLLREGYPLTGVNHLRIGESIMLGRDTFTHQPIAGLYQDVFQIKAEVIECQSKPTVPVEEVGRDAFGNVPTFEDRGIRRRALLAVGKQDFGSGQLSPSPGIGIIGATSDHLAVDVEAVEEIEVGNELAFTPDYGALVGLMTSPYVRKSWKEVQPQVDDRR